MTLTLCDLCDTEGATYCHRHHRDECDQCGCEVAA